MLTTESAHLLVRGVLENELVERVGEPCRRGRGRCGRGGNGVRRMEGHYTTSSTLSQDRAAHAAYGRQLAAPLRRASDDGTATMCSSALFDGVVKKAERP